jgi:hypothetical protein
VLAIVELGTNPISIVRFRRLKCGATAAKWVKNEIAWVCGHQNGSLWDDKLKLVDPWPNF